jgi:hypothetical protein
MTQIVNSDGWTNGQSSQPTGGLAGTAVMPGIEAQTYKVACGPSRDCTEWQVRSLAPVRIFKGYCLQSILAVKN